MSLSFSDPLRVVGSARHNQLFWRQPAWWVCLFSLLCLTLAQFFAALTAVGGTLAAGGFVLFWIAYASAHPGLALRDLISVRLCWLLPCLALASVLWSQDPLFTARTSVELSLTVCGAVLVSRRVQAGGFIAALMLVLFIAIAVSLASGHMEDIGTTNQEALAGAFGSKNYMGEMAAIFGLCCVAVLADGAQPAPMHLAAMAGTVIAPLLVWEARSIDALGAYASGLGVLAAVLVLSRIPKRLRAPVALVTAVLGLLGLVWVIVLTQGSSESLLSAFGKDSTLTGRTYLWYRADALIAQHPLLGIGYQAFWRQGNLEAEGLWRALDVEARAGFHFHNLFYEAAIELGILGLIAVALLLFRTSLSAFRLVLRSPGAQTAFFAAFALFVVVRCLLEVDVMFPFDLGTFVFAATYAYVTQAVGAGEEVAGPYGSGTRARSLPPPAWDLL
jgi:exopolysaccharide production protein ExoQ